MKKDTETDDILAKEKNLALVVSCCHNNEQEIAKEHLNELEQLAYTAGLQVVEKQIFVLKRIDAATYLTQGKLEQLLITIVALKVKTVIFDNEISPSQQRNLEKFLQISVIDRAELILDIFSQRALTLEAKIQVELARSKYMFPRLKRLWGHFSRQRAKGGFLKGEGEKQIELDKRMLKDRIAVLTKQLKKVIEVRETQRNSRKKLNIFSFSIIGYTNAGKSSLLNYLTRSKTLVEDKLFATLDPKTKKITFPNKKTAIVTDTVGLIRKLPHTLVAAFKSTLEATLHSDVLIHVVDVSNPAVEEHIKTTYQVLEELKIFDLLIITVLNKIDLLLEPTILQKLKSYSPFPVECSTKTGQGLEKLLLLMEEFVSKNFQKVTLSFTCNNYGLFAELVKGGYVLSYRYEEDVLIVDVNLPLSILHKYLPFEVKNN